MPKQQQKKSNKPNPASTLKPLTPAEKTIRFLSEKKNQLFLIFASAFIYYGNSIGGGYVLDDGLFIDHNRFVQQGFAGIYDLFTKETMLGYVGNASGGRWHPLSLITFAVEKELFGSSPHVSHFINVLLLALTGVVMILFLRKHIFKTAPLAAFFTTLLFVIHPIHTEAVANVKSRDEILSWLFLVLTLHYSLNFLTKKNYRQLFLALIYYFLGLISKENGVTFIAILPLTFYFFTKEKWKTILFATLPFLVVFGFYWLLRHLFVPYVPPSPGDVIVLNNPYLNSMPVQRLATELMVLGKYLLLLFYPNPLSCDYSYNTIPLVNFTDWRVWLSVIIQAALVIYALVKVKGKDIVAYGILFYFCSIFIYSNIIDLGGLNLGERFLYQPSFGFCIAFVVFVTNLVQKIKFKDTQQKLAVTGSVCVIIILLSAFQTIKRNAEWATNLSLWSADIKKVPNSARAQNALGTTEITKGTVDTIKRKFWLNDAILHLKRATDISPVFIDAWLNMGVAYSRLDVLDSEEYCWNRARAIDPNYPKLKSEFDPVLCDAYLAAAGQAGSKTEYDISRHDFYKALHYNPKSADAWYNLGGYYFVTQNFDSARIAWQQCLKLKPDYTDAQRGLKALPGVKK